jgi:hypothetical protein
MKGDSVNGTSHEKATGRASKWARLVHLTLLVLLALVVAAVVYQYACRGSHACVYDNQSYTYIVSHLNSRRHREHLSPSTAATSTHGRIDTREAITSPAESAAWAHADVGLIVPCENEADNGIECDDVQCNLVLETLLRKDGASSTPLCCEMPYRSTVPRSAYAFAAGTGTLVGKDQLLTARHALYDPNNKRKQCVVFGWRQLNIFSAHPPRAVARDNVCTITEIISPYEKLDETAAHEDWAVVSLRCQRPRWPTRKVVLAGPTRSSDTLHAYAHPFGTPLKYTDRGKYKSDEGLLNAVTLDVASGFSGSAVLNQEHAITGIVRGSGALSGCFSVDGTTRRITLDLSTGETRFVEGGAPCLGARNCFDVPDCRDGICEDANLENTVVSSCAFAAWMATNVVPGVEAPENCKLVDLLR